MTSIENTGRRLIGSVKRKYFRQRYGDAPFVTRYWGADFTCTLSNSVTKGIAAGTYEHDQLTIMSNWVRANSPDRFLDIGANIGLYSCILLRAGLVRSAIAFEPDHGNIRELEANATLNGVMDRLDVCTYALSDEARTALFEEGPSNNRGNSRLLDQGRGVPVYEVELRRFDDLYDFRGETLAIKIDVEGHEFPVLRGMQRALENNRCFLQIESFSRGYEVWMRERGYRCEHRVRDDYFWTR